MGNRFFSAIKEEYFGEHLDFRVHIFNTLGFLGCALGLIFGVFSIVMNAGLGNVVANLSASAAAAGIIWYANRADKYGLFFLVTVILAFFLIFPALFFMGGGYVSGMPCFFVFAVVFTAMMLEGRRHTVFILLEVLLYAGCFLTAVVWPETVAWFPTEEAATSDIIAGCLASCAVLAIAIHRHISIYDKKQKELEKANAALAELDRAKNNFFANASHEVRTPLTVISVDLQSARDILADTGTAESEAFALLDSAQSEILRLSRLVDGLLALALSGHDAVRQKIDFSELLQGRAGAVKSEIERGLVVFGTANLLARAIDDLLQNADALCAVRRGGEVVVTIRHRGADAEAEIPPLCRIILESHGGRLGLPVTPGEGATFSIPFYQGQFGPDGKE